MRSEIFGFTSYSVNEVSDILMVNSETVRKWIREKSLRGINSGSKKEGYRISSADLLYFLECNSKYAKRFKRLHGKDFKQYIELHEQCMENTLFKSIYNEVSYDVYSYLIFRYTIEDDLDIILEDVEELLGTDKFKKITGLQSKKEREQQIKEMQDIIGID